MKARTKVRVKKPDWLRRPLPSGAAIETVRGLLKKGGLHTVCQEARCPNLWECYARHTATFLILGDRCTRNCAFCAVQSGPPLPPDPEEPLHVADAAKEMGLKYVVVTSVTRDDLPDGGAGLFAQTIVRIKQAIPQALVEVLIPDFQGDEKALETVVKAGPAVLNHNVETVARLYPKARPQAKYQRSLELISRVKAMNPDLPAKSGLMLGLGETREEIRQTLADLLRAGCQILTIGQYLQPSAHHLPVERFVPPKEFDLWKQTALEMGFSEAASGPFVRSSYRAQDLFDKKS